MDTPQPKKVGCTFTVREKGEEGKKFHGITEEPVRIVASVGDTVVWGILNVHHPQARVKLGNCRMINNSSKVICFGAAGEPFSSEIQIDNGKTGTIEVTIPAGTEDGLYLYDIYLGGRKALDPELQIET